MTLRWQDAVYASGDEVVPLWETAAESTPEVTLVLGEGFDPRTLIALDALSAADVGPTHVVAINLSHGATAEHLRERGTKNRAAIESAVQANSGRLTRLNLPDVEDPRSLGKAMLREVENVAASGSTMIVDVSALPSRIFLPVTAGLIEATDRGEFKEILVGVCENPALDRAISTVGPDLDPGPIGGFAHGLTSLTEPAVLIWAPVLGEGQEAQLRALLDYQAWTEICPVLPFPAQNPRRADNLIVEHEYLFRDPVEAEEGNIIYADERHPFDLYRALCRLDEWYTAALEPLGTSRLVLSTHASKTLSVGVLLASVERKLPVIAAAFGGSYSWDQATDVDEIARSNRLSTYWLAGQPYAQ